MEREELLYVLGQKLGKNDIKIAMVNIETAKIVEAYLKYASDIVAGTQTKQPYGTNRFSQLGDDLIITPDELLELIDKVQVALADMS